MQLPNKVIIKQKVEALEIFTSFETNNRYQVFSEQGQPLLYAYEESNFFGKQFLGSHRGLTIHVIDNNKQPVFSLERPFYFLNANYTLHKADGSVMGEMKQTKWFMGSRFSLGSYVIEMKLPHIWTFKILQGGVQVGLISKKWSGVGKEMFSDADNFLVDFGSVSDKMLILAAAFAIDTRNFEHKK